MKVLVLDEPGHFRRTTDEPPPPPGPGEALVRVRRVGVCGTDFHAFRGRQPFFTYPRILGHELGVEVVALNAPDSGLNPGDWCTVEPYLNCGRCVACRAGKTNCCVSLQCLGVHTDGGMREMIIVPARKLHRSDRLTLDQLALVETLGIGAHAVNRARIEPDETALVIGTGPIGLSVIQFAKQSGARVLAMDVNGSRLDFVSTAIGVDETIPAGENALAAVERLTGGDLPTVVFDATGNVESMERAFQFVAHGGRLAFVGLVQADIRFHDPHFHRRELTLLSSRNSTAADFGRIIGLMERGEIDTTPWITHRASIDDMIPAFPTWLDPETGCLKAIVEIEA